MERITFYGTRGSYSLTSSKYAEFGGATTCLMLAIGNENIVVDCGSGINNALEDLANLNEINIFITHTHIDHIIGITNLLAAFDDKKINIWGKTRNGITIKDAVDKIMNQSLWPVRVDTYKNVSFFEIDKEVSLGNVKITTMDSNHPGGSTLYRFDAKDDSIVTAFDFSHLNGYDEKLIEFAKCCKTLIYDGYFKQSELDTKGDWGHSTPEIGALIGEKCGAFETIITHYGIYDDEELKTWEKEVQKSHSNVRFARVGKHVDELKKMVEIGALLSEEKDNDVLLEKIVLGAMDITNCDGGTLYLLNGDMLDFKVLINRSKNTNIVKKDSPINLPSVNINGNNSCSVSARLKKLINIEDCYAETEYDFSGSKEYDRLNNYRTKAVMVVPLVDDFGDVVGVLQLINPIGDDGLVKPFKKSDEDVVLAIANQASISIVNSSYSAKVDDLLYGFVKVLSVQIDERTPYNANHTRNMVRFAENFFDYEEKINGLYNVDYKKKREILMSIWLHDVGKILTPIEIMNKDSRLGEQYSVVVNRFERRELLLKLACANLKITKEEYEKLEQERQEQLEFVNTVNKVGFLAPDLKEKVDDLASKTYEELDGSIKPIITSDEHYQLSIVKGTLNKEERHIMESHVSMTQKFLSQLNFPKYYSFIPEYAGNHHEFLNGTGYPNHLKEEDLPWPCRLITICDIFEALTAKDRPYKKPLSVEKSLSILYEMADNGQLDRDVIKEFESSEAWKEEK